MAKKCDNCDQLSAVNIQKLWIKWEYESGNDEYSQNHELLNIEPLDSDNLHLCNECMKLWEQGEI